jgi:hypothetical protein
VAAQQEVAVQAVANGAARVPVAVVGPLPLAALAAAVLAAANVLAAGPARLAARSHQGQLLRAE